MKIVPATADNVAFGETERVRAREFAAKLSMRVLSRMWQMLLKGITEVQTATRPAAAAEMVLVRIAYVADLPTPDEAIRMIEQNGGGAQAAYHFFDVGVVAIGLARHRPSSTHVFNNLFVADVFVADASMPTCRRGAALKRPRVRR